MSGNPGDMSPVEAAASPDYEHLGDYLEDTYPRSATCVVRHRATGSIWCAIYAMRDDDSDAGLPGQWFRCAKSERVITEYRRDRG